MNRNEFREMVKILSATRNPNRELLNKTFEKLKFKGSFEQKLLFFEKANLGTLNPNAFGYLFPDQPWKIGKMGLFYTPTNLKEESEWKYLLLYSFWDRINRFAYLEKQFESRFLLGELHSTLEILQQIETEMGWSLWLCEKKILLAYLNGGISEASRTKEELSKGIRPSLEFILEQIASKVDKEVPISVFSRSIQNLFEKSSLDQSWRNLYQYSIDYYGLSNDFDSDRLLCFYSIMPVVDQFLLVRSELLREGNRYLNEFQVPINAGSDDIAKIVKGKIFETLTVGLSAALSDRQQFFYSERNGEDVLSQKQYLKLLVLMLEEFKQMVRLGVFDMMYFLHIIRYSILIDEDVNAHIEASSILHLIAHEVKSVVSEIGFPERSFETLRLIRRSCGLNVWTLQFSLILDAIRLDGASSLMNIRMGRCLIESSLCMPEFKNSLYEIWVNKMMSSNILDSDSIHGKVELVYEKENYLIALNNFELLEKIVNVNSNFDVNQLLRTIDFGEIGFPCINSWLRFLIGKQSFGKGEIQLLVALIVEETFSDFKVLSKYNSSDLIDSIESNIDIKGDIFVPLFLFLYRYNSSATLPYLWRHVDDFLVAIGVSRPSEVGRRENFPLLQRIMFLRHICVPEVYDSSYLFSSVSELENERIECCKMLMELDPSRKEDSVQEISNILHTQRIREAIKQVEQTKIQVDVDRIWSTYSLKHLEDYEYSRYIMRALNRFPNLATSRRSASLPLIEISQGVWVHSSNLDLARDNFHNLLRIVRNLFVSSGEFGLDSYLSMRIRHGTLLGELRGVFERKGMMTKRDSETGKYRHNLDLHKAFGCEQGGCEGLDDFLASFSERIDSLAEEIKGNWLQVWYEGKPQRGLFDYSLSDLELDQFIASIDLNRCDFESFFSAFIDVLWLRTESNLKAVRDRLENDAKNSIFEALSEFDRNISLVKVGSKGNLAKKELLSSILECKTEVSNLIGRLVNWFRRPSISKFEDFDVGLAVEVSIKTIQRISVGFSSWYPDVDIAFPQVMRGEFFPRFADLFLILLDNCIKHSHLLVDELMTRIKIFKRNDSIVIVVINNLSTVVDLAEVNEKIEYLKKELLSNSNKNESKTKKEGGSGFYKIRKIINSDLARSGYNFAPEINQDSLEFSLEISFICKGLTSV